MYGTCLRSSKCDLPSCPRRRWPKTHNYLATSPSTWLFDRAINVFGAALMCVNAVCMAVLFVSALVWEGTPTAQKISNAVIIVQIVALGGTLFPRGGAQSFFGHETFQ